MPELGIFEVMYSCRAMRRLKPDPIPEALLLKLLDAGNQAPTGSNRQNVRWLVVRDPALKGELAEQNRFYLEQRSANADVPTHHEGAKRERMMQAVLWQAEHMAEIPAIIIACLEFDPGVKRPTTIGGNVWPAVQNLLLAARAVGLGATPTNLGLSNLQLVKDLLCLPENVDPYCLIPVGYPMGKYGSVTRLPVEQTVRWDRWEDK